jgi:hypothetical protein
VPPVVAPAAEPAGALDAGAAAVVRDGGGVGVCANAARANMLVIANAKISFFMSPRLLIVNYLDQYLER